MTKLILIKRILCICLLFVSLFNYASSQTTYTDSELTAIAQRMLQGKPVTAVEKNAAYDTFERIRHEQAPVNPPATDRVGGPDAYGYRFIDSAEPGGPTFSWQTNTGTNYGSSVSGGSADDGYYGPFNIGFNFSFYGYLYSQFYIGTNGYINFSAGTTSIPSFGTFPDANLPPAILFWGRDCGVNYTPVTVKYQSSGTSPNRMCVINVDSLNAYYNSGSYRISAQVVLYESGQILVQLRNYVGSPQTNYPGNIGIQSNNGSQYLAYCTTTGQVPAAGTAILFSTMSAPSNPVPTDGATNVSVNTTLSWTAGVGATGYDVYFGLVNPPTTMVSSNQTGLSYTSTGLDLSTPYYWKVVSRNGTATNAGPVWSFTTTSTPPLSGTKTIGGTNPDYATFSAAINALLTNGLADGGVTFSVRSGTYNELVYVPPIFNADSLSPVIFQKESGTVTLTPPVTASVQAGVKLSGSDWVTFDGIDVSDVSTSSNYLEYGYWLTDTTATNGAQHNTIKNCLISLRKEFSTIGLYQRSTNTISASSGNQSYNHYLNLKITRCRIGMQLTQGSSTYLDGYNEIGSTSEDLNFTGRMKIGGVNASDTIGGAGTSYGIIASLQYNLTIHNIDIKNVISTGLNYAYGLYYYYCPGTLTIYGCRVGPVWSTYTSSSNSPAYGLYFYPYYSSTIVKCYNNFISDIRSISTNTTATTSIYAHGIYAYSTNGTTYYIDNNTIYIDQGTQTYYASSALTTYSATVYLRNNIFANVTASQGGISHHYCIYRSSGTLASSNYNCFYIPNTTGGYVGYYTADQQSLAAWRAITSQDANSSTNNPLFISTSPLDLHLQTATPMNASATNVSWITTDIDGQPRDYIAPDIGADEVLEAAARIRSNPIAVNFGTVPVTMTSQRSIYIVNYGSQPLNVSNISFGTGFLPSWSNATIPANDSLILNITWAPSQTGALNQNATVTSNAVNNPSFTFGLTGTATQAIVLTSPNGGELYPATLNQGHRRMITWNRPGAPGYGIDLYLSTNSGTSWTTTIATGLPDTGSYLWTIPNLNGTTMRVKIVLRDEYNNIQAADSSNTNFTLDNVPPTGTITLSSPADQSTSGMQPVFQWTASGLNGVVNFQVARFSNPDWLKITQTANATTLTATPSAEEALSNSPPPVVWRVHGLDSAGNWVASAQSRTLTIDGVAPDTFSLLSPANNYWTNERQPSLSWAASNDGSGSVAYDVYIDSVVNRTNLPTTTTTPTSQLSYGAHNWYVIAKDPYNNNQVSNSIRNLVIGHFDVVAPTELQWFVDSSITFSWMNIAVSGMAFNRYEIRLDDQLYATRTSITDTTWTLSAAQALSNGSHTVTIDAFNAGGVGYRTPVRTFRIDRLPPNAFNLSSPLDNAISLTATPTLSWVATTDTGVGFGSYQLWIDGILVRSNLTGTSSTPPTALSEGIHTWTVKAVDLFGNTRQANTIRNIVIDTQIPTAATLISPINGDTTGSASPVFRWTRGSDIGSGIAIYKLYVASVQRGGNITPPVSGDTVTFSIPDSLPNGFYDWYVQTVDNANRTANSIYGYLVVRYGRITVLQPNGGEVYFTGMTDTIRWNPMSIPGNMRIELNRSYPSTNWETIINNTVNDGVEPWQITGPSTTTGRIRISSVSSSAIKDTSNGNFTIIEPQILLQYPNGGESLFDGDADTIRWLCNIPGTATLKWTRNYPTGNWYTLSNSITASSGQFAWTIPDSASTNVRFALISNSNTLWADTSNSNSSIVTRTIRITHPNGGEQLTIGVPDTIRWTSNFEGTVSVGYSMNGIDPFNFFILTGGDSVPLNQGYFVWTPQAPATNRGRIYLGEWNTGMEVWSSNDFIVVSTPMTLTLERPNGGEQLFVGESDTIRWVASHVPGTIRIEINRSSPTGSTWTVIDSAVSASIGQKVWLPTQPVSDSCRIRISVNTAPGINDASVSNFSIQERSIHLSAPNGGETKLVGIADTIRFNGSYLTNGIRIELNRNYPNGTWDVVCDSVAGTDTVWRWNSITAPTTNNARIRVSARGFTSPAYSDTSDANFSIQPQPTLYQSISTIPFASRRPRTKDSVLVVIANRSNLAFRYLTCTGATSSRFSRNILDIDSTTNANDSLRIWIRFTPDSTLTYNDTLRLTFETPYLPITIPLAGTGIGNYVTLSATTLNFSNTLEPTTRDSLTLWVRVKGNQPLSGANWIIIPSTAPFRVAPVTLPIVAVNDSSLVKVYFEPITQGSFNGQVALLSNAVNEDTLRVSVYGVSHYVPASPGTVVVTVAGENANLTWARVDTSVNGVPLIVQRYLIYFKSVYTNQWNFLAVSSGADSTRFIHQYVVTYSPMMYYQVTAWIGNTDSFDRIIRTIPVGTSEAEVVRRLGIANGE